jgi:hypothetical protein
MSCIGRDIELDPELHDLYAKNLLEPGWAGEVDDDEAAYIARKLTASPALRRVWRVAEFTRQRKLITPSIAKRLARWRAEMPLEGAEGAFSNTVDDDAGSGIGQCIGGVESLEATNMQFPLKELQPISV